MKNNMQERPVSLEEKQQSFAHSLGHLISYLCFMGFKVSLGKLSERRLAIELNIFDHVGNLLIRPEDLEPFGKYWEKIHPDNRWSGNNIKRVRSDVFELRDLAQK